MFDTRAFERALEGAVQDMERTADRALDDTADFIVKRAQQNAPVDTGELKNSIGTRASGKTSIESYIDIGSDDPVAIYQEFGTSKMDAHPFFRPAFAEAPAQHGRGA